MNNGKLQSQGNINGFFGGLLEFIKEPLVELIKTTIKDCLRAELNSIRSEPILKTRKETAELLHITLPTLKSLEDTGRLLPCRITDKRVVYDLKDIEVFLKRSREQNLGQHYHRGKILLQ